MKIVASLILLLMLGACGSKQESDAVDKPEIDPLKDLLIEAVSQMKRHNYDSARFNLNLADSLSHVLQNQYAQSSVLSNYALIWMRQNQYDSAANYYRQSLAIDLVLNDTASIIKHSNDLGKSYRALGYFGEAMKHYEVALKLALSATDSARIALSSNSLGNVLIELKDFKGASTYYDQALHYWGNLGQLKNYAIALQNKGTTLLEMDSVYRAISLLKKSQAIKDSLSTPSSRAYTLTSLGSAYMKVDSLPQAQAVLAKALSIRQAIGNEAAIAETELELARLAFLRDDFPLAEDLLNKIQKIAIQLAKPDLHRDALEAKKNLYWQWGKYRIAGEVDQQFDLLNDSIYREEKLKVQKAQSESVLEGEREKTKLAEQIARLALLEKETEEARSALRLLLILITLSALCVILWQLWLIKQRNKALTSLNSRIKLITDNAFHSQANALSLLSSLLRSKYRQLVNQGEKEVLEMVNQKVDALSLLTKQIFQIRLEDVNAVSDKVALADYLKSLIEETIGPMPEDKVTLHIQLAPVEVTPKVALNLGLVINELMTNSFKYAVPKGATQLSFTSQIQGTQLEFTYQDNGPGFNLEGKGAKTSFGTKMINMLIENDLNGRVVVDNSSGARYKIEIEI